ncbi:hypothetical protein DEIPH_ctg103orf0068 [Deinococcus phoenicis]|uniref:Uncharacterized protein n=1 Tax=Deinococcus phoenicis TaxID=1476583 RepID=A0A016QKR1_9DEIO|nr:hypothetical protein [Deinococcus phoenicis]EYB66536.1 hypothetical protein DEIPH_ctg103orf0068 [Deinococcus phoenicis]
MRKGAALLLTVLASAALADTYVPGTTVSYSKSRDPITGANTSSVFLDEVNDTVNKTYVELSCQQGGAVFYLYTKDPLYTLADYKAGTTPDIVYRVDTLAARTVPTVWIGEENKPVLTALAVPDELDPQLLGAFKSARSKVLMRVKRSDGRELTYTFPVRGLPQALQAVNHCR